MTDTQLSALQRTVSTGSKLIITGCGLALSAGLLKLLLASGAPPGHIKPPGVEIPLPAPLALLVLIVSSLGVGWTGWAFLWQARKLMRRLEFDDGVNPDEIRATLAGSSVLSASVNLVRLLCFVATIALDIASPAQWPGVTFLITPYFYLVVSTRIRWFNPESWSAPFWLFRFLFRKERRQMGVNERAIHELLSTEKLGAYAPPAFTTRLQEAASNILPDAFAMALGPLVRKYGVTLLFPWNRDRWDVEYLEVFMKAYMEVLDPFLKQQLPDAPPEARTSFRNRFLELVTRL